MMVLEVVHKWITLSTGCGARGAVDNWGKSQSGYRMASQLKRPGWCANTSSSGPDPDKEGYMNTTRGDLFRTTFLLAKFIDARHTKSDLLLVNLEAAFRSRDEDWMQTAALAILHEAEAR